MSWLVLVLQVLEALTSRAFLGDVSYETLEFLGDSILKFTGCTYLFLKDFFKTDEHLGDTLYELVRNQTLFCSALSLGLAKYALVEPFSCSLWVPPGTVRVEGAHLSCLGKEQGPKFQLVPCGTLADIVEALLGAYLLEGGLHMALQAMTWLHVPIQFPTSVPEPIRASLFETRSCLELIDVDELEGKLGYSFKNKALIARALEYEHLEYPENSLFRRLVFLGDGIFDYVIIRHLVREYPDKGEGKLNELKQAIRNKENLARLAFEHGLHVHFCKVSPSLEQPIAEYATSFMKEGGKVFGLSTLSSPQV